MICYVAADFGPMDGQMFSVKANQIGTFIEAPGWIRNTLMFRWLVNDGSIKVADEQISRKQGENDPMKGMGADGKIIRERKTPAKKEEVKEEPSEEAKEEVVEEMVEEPAKAPAKRKRKKADDAK